MLLKRLVNWNCTSGTIHLGSLWRGSGDRVFGGGASWFLFLPLILANTLQRDLIWREQLYMVGEERAYVSMTVPGEFGSVSVKSWMHRRDPGADKWEFELVDVVVRSNVDGSMVSRSLIDRQMIYPDNMTHKA
jgi:hypothetical protein